MNYKTFSLTKRELIIELILFLFFDATIAFLFFDSIYAFLLLLVFMPVYFKKRSKDLCVSKSLELKAQFCEMISLISTNLSAGLSVENSFRECVNEMEKMYGSEAAITIELRTIITKLELNVPISECLIQMSQRAKIEDISDFVTVFVEAGKSGGNLRDIIQNTVSVIEEKKRIEDEINAMLKGKMLEQKVISAIPFLLFAYLRISSKDFIQVLYHNVIGIIVMTLCLIIYVIAFIMSEKIVNIKV